MSDLMDVIDTIALGFADYAWATEIGVRRRKEGGQKDNWPQDSMDKAYKNDILGAAGELVVANLLGVPWEASVNRFRKDGDVCGLEVRASNWVTRGKGLKIKPWESEKKPEMGVVWVVAVPDRAQQFLVVGWCLAEAGPVVGQWYDPSHGRSPKTAPGWFVPHEFLSRELVPLLDMAIAWMEAHP